jgi:uncharacterized protein YoxC
MGEKLAKTKDADIHIRCFREDKKYVESRAKDGFGKKTNSMTNFVLYAIRHVDDSSPIDIEQAEGLIQTIGDNRQTLAAVHEDINGIPQELNELGNNLNQIAKATNTILKIAREDDETPKETVDKIVAFEREVSFLMKELYKKIGEFNKTIQQARTRINSTLRKEDEILTRCLVFPTVGEKARSDAQLLRMLQDFKKSTKLTFDMMTVAELVSILKIEPKTETTNKD